MTVRGYLKGVDDNNLVAPSKKSTRQFLEEWVETMRSQISPKTHERYAEIINHFLVPALGTTQLSKLEPTAIQRAYNGWESRGRRDGKKGGLAPRTRVHIHRVLRSALKHAVRMRIIAFNPADAVIPPRAKKATSATLTIEQSSVLLDALKLSQSYLYWPVLLA